MRDDTQSRSVDLLSIFVIVRSDDAHDYCTSGERRFLAWLSPAELFN